VAKIERFEELIAWQKARELTKEIYQICRLESFKKDLGLKTQMQRAAVSIMANLAEGFERGRLTEFHQFISIAKSSCAELRSHLYVALDAGYLESHRFGLIMSKAREVSLILGGLRVSVAKQPERKNRTELPIKKEK
jgi:four helix bundle protein